MSFREVITLQVGHYANHVGAHWWNIQESSFVYDPAKATGPKEICHDVLFREGITLQNQVTFTPRLVAFDLKGSLCTLKQDGTLYESVPEGEEIQWLGDVTMHEEEPAPRNPFLESLDEDEETINSKIGSKDTEQDDEKLEEAECILKKRKSEDQQKTALVSDTGDQRLYNLDNTVNVWSDFLRVHYHPKSIHIVEDYRHNDEYRVFDLFNCATEVLNSYESTCQWEDRLHHFTEECDNLQGFHVLADTHNGFGGISAGLLRYLEDEFPGKGVLTFGFTPADLPDDTATVRAARIINSALAYDKLSMHSSLFVPTSLARGLWRVMEPPREFPSLSYKPNSYHTSAILAANLDTLSLPYRLETGAINIRDITHSFNAQGRTVASLNSAFPLGLYSNESIVDFISRHEEHFPWQSLTPHIKNASIPIMQSVVMRGVSNEQVKSQTDIRKIPEYLRGIKSCNEVLNQYYEQKCAGNLFAVNCLDTPIKTTIPFPHIFKEEVTKRGHLCDMPRPQDLGVEALPQMTSLQCNTEVGGMISHLHSVAMKMNIKKHHRYLELGLEEDEYEEVLDNLESLSRKYYLESEGL